MKKLAIAAIVIFFLGILIEWWLLASAAYDPMKDLTPVEQPKEEPKGQWI